MKRKTYKYAKIESDTIIDNLNSDLNDSHSSSEDMC